MRTALHSLTGNERAALDVYISRLHEHFGDLLERVVLFGSKARGEAHPESDLDVLVLLRQADWKLRDEVALLAFDPMITFSVVLSPLVSDSADFSWWQEHHAPIYRSLSREGIVLWTKHPVS